jgi:hypothetical protein
MSEQHEHYFYSLPKFHKGLVREITKCSDCEYKKIGKVLFTKSAYSHAWFFSPLRDSLTTGYYEIKVCIPCGHITVPHYSGEPIAKLWRKQMNEHAFDKPRYMGDCKYLHFQIPRWLGAMMPKRLRYTGISYKKYSTWEKPGWVEEKE